MPSRQSSRVPVTGLSVAEPLRMSASSVQREQEVIRHIQSIAADTSGSFPALSLSFEEMMTFTKFDYVDFDAVAGLMSNVATGGNEMIRRSAVSEGPGSNIKKESSFQLWIAKGPGQFQLLLDQKIVNQHIPLTFESFLVKFYKEIFPDEADELNKLPDKNELWHIVLVGLNVKKIAQIHGRWEVLSAICFTPFKDNETMYLSWIGSSQEKCAEPATWGYKENDDKFFDGNRFAGKGLGSFLISSMQYVCRKSTKMKNSYNTILLQSSYHATGFYRTAVGMREMSSIDKLLMKEEIQDLKIKTEMLIFMKLSGDFNSMRPPNIHQQYHDMTYLMKKSYVDFYDSSTTKPDFQSLPSPLLQKKPNASILFPSHNITWLRGTSKAKRNIRISDDLADDSAKKTKNGLKLNITQCNRLLLQLVKNEDRQETGTFVNFSKEVVGLVLVRLLLHEYASKLPKQQLTPIIDIEPQLQLLATDEAKMFEAERLFLINIMWYITKMDHGVDHERLESKSFYKPETVHGVKRYINTTNQSKKDDYDFSDWEKSYMSSAQFVDAVIDAAEDGKRHPMNPLRFRSALGIVYKKLASAQNEFDTSHDAILLLLSMVFDVSIILIKFWKFGPKENDYAYVHRELNASVHAKRQIYIHTYAKFLGEIDLVCVEKAPLMIYKENGDPQFKKSKPEYGIFIKKEHEESLIRSRVENIQYRKNFIYNNWVIEETLKEDEALLEEALQLSLEESKLNSTVSTIEGNDQKIINQEEIPPRAEKVSHPVVNNLDTTSRLIGRNEHDIDNQNDKNVSDTEMDIENRASTEVREDGFQLQIEKESGDSRLGEKVIGDDFDNQDDQNVALTASVTEMDIEDRDSTEIREDGDQLQIEKKSLVTHDILEEDQEDCNPGLKEKESADYIDNQDDKNVGWVTNIDFETEDRPSTDIREDDEQLQIENESFLEDYCEKRSKKKKTQEDQEEEAESFLTGYEKQSRNNSSHSSTVVSLTKLRQVPSRTSVAVQDRTSVAVAVPDNDEIQTRSEVASRPRAAVSKDDDDMTESDGSEARTKKRRTKNVGFKSKRDAKPRSDKKEVTTRKQPKVLVGRGKSSSASFMFLLQQAGKLAKENPSMEAKFSLPTNPSQPIRDFYQYDSSVTNMKLNSREDNEQGYRDFQHSDEDIHGFDNTKIVLGRLPIDHENHLNNDYNEKVDKMSNKDKRNRIPQYRILEEKLRDNQKEILQEYRTVLLDNIKNYKKATKEHDIQVCQEKVEKAYADLQDLHLSMETELFLAHQDNIVALKYLKKPYLDRYRFLALSNKVIKNDNDDGLFRLIIPLTKVWVEQNYKREFIKVVMEEGVNNGHIHFDDLARNVTQETIQLAEENKSCLYDTNGGHDLAKKRLFGNFRGENENKAGGEEYYILALKCVCTYQGDNVEPLTTIWKIQSISKRYYEFQEEKRKSGKNPNKHIDYEEWFDMDVGLVMHDSCIGSKTALPLQNSLDKKRKTIVHRNRNNAPTPLKHISTLESDTIDFTKDLKRKQLPVYNFGEKQVCSIKYDSEKRRFWGRTIVSVFKNKRSTYAEILSEEWVKANFSDAFLATIMKRTDKFLWIPIGNARPNSVYPYEYNLAYPQIKFQQGNRETCVTSSFANCLHFMKMEYLASWVESFGRNYIEDTSKDQSRLIQSLVHSICTNTDAKEFNSNWQFKRLVPDKFDIIQAAISNPMLLQLLGSDGSVGHAISVYQGMIFDSNLKYAVDVDIPNLEYCCGAAYVGIVYGYECIPINHTKHRRPKKKHKKNLQL